MRRHTLLLSALILSLGWGCQARSAVTSPAAGEGGMPSASQRAVPGTGLLEAATGLVELEIDLLAQTGTVSAVPARSGQDNDDLFELPIDNFLNPNSFRFRGIRREGSQLYIDYRIVHPFASSEVSNRADLAFAGFLLFLFDAPPEPEHEFFGGADPVITDLRRIPQADGYYRPNSLLNLPGFRANTFPYMQVVDDSGDGNRVDPGTGAPITNWGSPMGNFERPAGWQTGNSSEWTGYGVLHQGQAADNTVCIDLDALDGAAKFSLLLALIARYNDPRSGTPGYEHRLPSDPPSVTDGFGYRMPWGALDHGRVRQVALPAKFIELESGFEQTFELDMQIEDWDARAPQVGVGSLADEPDAGVIEGPSIPLLTGVSDDRMLLSVELAGGIEDDDTEVGGDPEPDMGYPGDALYYSYCIRKASGDPGNEPVGPGRGLVRIAEDDDPPPVVYLTSDLSPITGAAPEQATYQALDFEVVEPRGWARQYGAATYDQALGTAVDSKGHVWVTGGFTGVVDFGGGPRTSNGDMDIFLLQLSQLGTYLSDFTLGGAGFDIGTGLVSRPDGGVVYSGGISPEAGILPFCGPITGSGLTPVVLAIDDGVLDWCWTANGPGNALPRGINTDADGGVAATGSFTDEKDFGGGTRTSAGGDDIFWLRLNEIGGYRSDETFGGTGTDIGLSVTPTGQGSDWLTGQFEDEVDFGWGPRTSMGGSDIPVVELDSDTGAPLSDMPLGSPGNAQGTSIRAPGGLKLTIAGHFQTSLSFGGGDLTSNGGVDGFVYQMDLNGQNPVMMQIGGTDDDYLHQLIDNGQDLWVSGSWRGPTDFGDGGGTVNPLGSQDGYLARLGVDLSVQWVAKFGGIGADTMPLSLGLGLNDEAYLGGSFSGTSDFDPGSDPFTMTSFGSYDAFSVRVLPNGSWRF